MSTIARLVVEGLDWDDDETLAKLADYGWSYRDGIVLMTVASDGDLVAAVNQAVRCLAHVVPTARVLNVWRDLVSLSDVAARVGVSKEAVRKWTLRQGFPAPIGTVGTESTRPSRIWEWATVAGWLEATLDLDFDEHLADAKTTARIDAMLADVLDTTLVWQDLSLQTSHIEAVSARARRTRLDIDTGAAFAAGAQIVVWMYDHSASISSREAQEHVEAFELRAR